MAIQIQPIQVPSQTASILWVPSIQIVAPSPNAPVRATVTVCPMTESGSLLLEQKKTFVVNDLLTKAQTNAAYGTAVTAMYSAIQAEVNARALYGTGSVQSTGSVAPSGSVSGSNQ